MRGTFVVWEAGVTACLESDDTQELWTAEYRIGLAHGLLFDPDERPTVRDRSLRDALMALDPLPDCSGALEDLVEAIATNTEAGELAPEFPAPFELERFVRQRVQVRPAAEHSALNRLADHLNPPPF